jgi:hypothetical protein
MMNEKLKELIDYAKNERSKTVNGYYTKLNKLKESNKNNKLTDSSIIKNCPNYTDTLKRYEDLFNIIIDIENAHTEKESFDDKIKYYRETYNNMMSVGIVANKQETYSKCIRKITDGIEHLDTLFDAAEHNAKSLSNNISDSDRICNLLLAHYKNYIKSQKLEIDVWITAVTDALKN